MAMKPSVIAPNSDLSAIAFGRPDGIVGVNSVMPGGRQDTIVPNLRLHTGAVTRVGFSPDDRQVCSAGKDGLGTSLIIDEMRGQQLRGHQGPVNDIALSGRNTAITGSNDFTARIWNVLDGKALHNLKCPDIVRSVSMSARGETAAATYAAKILIIDAGDGKTLHEIPVDHPILQLAYSRDGKMLASGSDHGKVSVWDLSKAGDIIKVPCMHVFQHRSAISALAFRRDGSELAAGDRKGQAMGYNMETGGGKSIALPDGRATEILSIGFDAAGQSLVFYKAPSA